MKAKLQKYFGRYDKDDTPVTYKHDGYSDVWHVTIYGTLATETIMALVADGYEFDVTPNGSRLRIKIY